MLRMRLAVTGDLAERAMERSKMPRNCCREVWYMTFTMDISMIRKYSTEPRAATGRYSSRAVLIFTSVSSATSNL